MANDLMKPILVLDFDGVCSSYISGWKGIDILPDPPVISLEAFLRKAIPLFSVNIFSTRSKHIRGRLAMQDWFHKYYPELVDYLEFPATLPSAHVIINDRALTFTGQFPDTAILLNFKSWMENED